MTCAFFTANHTSTTTMTNRRIQTTVCMRVSPLKLARYSTVQAKKNGGPAAAVDRSGLASSLVVVHALAQFLAGLEVRHVLARHLHLLAGLGVAPRSRRPVVQPERAEPADLDAIAGRERVRHRVQHRLDRQLGILGCQLAVARAQQLDEL